MPDVTIYEETDWPTGLCGTVFTPAQLGCCRLTAAQILNKRGGFQFAYESTKIISRVDPKEQFSSDPAQAADFTK